MSSMVDEFAKDQKQEDIDSVFENLKNAGNDRED